MLRVGNDQAGYTVAVDPGSSTVRVIGWGFWPADVVSGFVKTVLDVGRAASGSRIDALALDFRRLKPQRDDAVEAFRALFKALPKHGIARVSVVTSSPLTRLQIVRVANEETSPGIVQFTTDTAGVTTPGDKA